MYDACSPIKQLMLGAWRGVLQSRRGSGGKPCGPTALLKGCDQSSTTQHLDRRGTNGERVRGSCYETPCQPLVRQDR